MPRNRAARQRSNGNRAKRQGTTDHQSIPEYTQVYERYTLIAGAIMGAAFGLMIGLGI